jgi:hypothetical protein
MYELWPGPTQGQTFYTKYQIIGVDFTLPADVQPLQIPDALIVQWALLYHVYPWARVNAGHFPAMSKVNWTAAIEDARRAIHGTPGTAHKGFLQDSIREDDNIANQSVLNRGHGLRNRVPFPYPIDANFLQSHLVRL